VEGEAHCSVLTSATIFSAVNVMPRAAHPVADHTVATAAIPQELLIVSASRLRLRRKRAQTAA